MTIHLITCRGIGEQTGTNMILGGIGGRRGVVGRLPAGKFPVHDLPWAANYGPVGGVVNAQSYGRNVEQGMDLIAAKLAELPEGDKAILLGFSAGATLAGNYAAYARGDVHHRGKIAGVGLIADPMMPRGVCDVDPESFGVGGERRIPEHDFPVQWIYNPRDMICCCPTDSPLRTIADQTFALSFAPGAAPLWIADLVDRVKTRRWQAVKVEWWHPLRVIAQYRRALEDAHGYLFAGEHINYDDAGPYTGTQKLADFIMEIAKETA